MSQGLADQSQAGLASLAAQRDSGGADPLAAHVDLGLDQRPDRRRVRRSAENDSRRSADPACQRVLTRPTQRAESACGQLADDRRVWRNLLDRFPHPYTLGDAHDWIAWATRAAEPIRHLAIEVEGALESFSTLAEGSPSYVYDDDEEEEEDDEDDDDDAVSEFYNAPVAAAAEDVEEIPPLVTSSRTSSPTLEAADFARPAPDTKVPGLDRRWCTAVAAGPFARYAKFFLREFGVEQALNVDDVEISDGDEEAKALELEDLVVS